MTCHMYDWQTISHICKMRLLIEMPSDQKVRRCCILLEFCSMLNTSASRTTSKESRKSERGERGGAEAIRGTINSFGFLCSFSSFALHNSQFLNLNGRKQRGERQEGRKGGGALALTQSTAKCRCHAMKQTNKSSVRPTAEAAAAATEKYATISHISAAAVLLA